MAISPVGSQSRRSKVPSHVDATNTSDEDMKSDDGSPVKVGKAGRKSTGKRITVSISIGSKRRGWL